MGADQHLVGFRMTEHPNSQNSVYIATEEDGESLSRQFDVAQNAVESGSAITDHIGMTEDSGTITGYLLGDGGNNVDGQNALAQLMLWQERGTVLQFFGRRFVAPMIISGIEHSYNNNAINATKVSITWKFLRVVQRPEQIVVAVKKPVGDGDGVWVTVQPGNTYWGWMMQYGTPLDTLRGWNHWPDRFIPIGVRARVK